MPLAQLLTGYQRGAELLAFCRDQLQAVENQTRQFDRPLPHQAWVCDITYIRTRSGWLYLAAVLDLHSRKIVGWAMALRNFLW